MNLVWKITRKISGKTSILRVLLKHYMSPHRIQHCHYELAIDLWWTDLVTIYIYIYICVCVCVCVLKLVFNVYIQVLDTKTLPDATSVYNLHNLYEILPSISVNWVSRRRGLLHKRFLQKYWRKSKGSPWKSQKAKKKILWMTNSVTEKEVIKGQEPLMECVNRDKSGTRPVSHLYKAKFKIWGWYLEAFRKKSGKANIFTKMMSSKGNNSCENWSIMTKVKLDM